MLPKDRLTWSKKSPLSAITNHPGTISSGCDGHSWSFASKYRYILVVCDYATGFSEAIPIKNIDAETVAEELMGIFA
uniref:Integrase catalytic domain-containing protein n=1 Tax=Amphimedon queenslandica TaxID=400682 RepID=A0A1X7U5P2_AMPQE